MADAETKLGRPAGTSNKPGHGAGRTKGTPNKEGHAAGGKQVGVGRWSQWEVSQLLDPRIGRGFFNTFHAQHFLMRWPLDHIFHSSDFKLIKIRRLKSIGSDHFPIYINLHFEPTSKQLHEEPQADRQEEQEAKEKIRDADPKKYQQLAAPENDIGIVPNP